MVSIRREAMASAANCSVAWPAKGGGEPAIFRTALQSDNMVRTSHEWVRKTDNYVQCNNCGF